jgi:HK97 family phage prohead protease
MHLRKKDRERKYRQRELTFKTEAVTEDGRFKGYASVFGVLDSYREIVAPGAFSESLQRIKDSGHTLPALWHHIASQPIGGYDQLSEDDRGLYVEGFLLKDDIPQARVAYVTMQRNIVTGLSIGYYVEAESWNEKDRILTLTKVDLVEVSVVTFPANSEARAEAVRAKLARGMLPTLREFEVVLREQGFSRGQAAAIAERGLKGMLDQGDLGGGNAYGDFLKQRRDSGGFSLPKF